MEKYYITTAIDYVNAKPHIGHAYEKIAADIIARFHRLLGYDVFFLSGLDEHGSKIEKAAKQSGIDPQKFCDQMSESFRLAWKSLDISFDYFIRTTEKRHVQSVQEIWSRLQSKGDIYKASYKGLYCDGCEDFVRERDLDEEGRCPAHKVKPKEVSEENYFFRLSKYKEHIKDLIKSDKILVRPESRKSEVLNQLEDPDLTDFSITRSRLSLNWGIPVPNDDNQVIYVWLDALTNYITGLGFPGDKEMMDRYWPANLHLIGKDITKFHTIYWPAMLISADLPLPKQVYGHGFITVEGQKISKSLGNVIDPIALVDEYGSDAVRYALLACTPFDQDGDFSKEVMLKKVNADLANNLGNLLNRTLTLVEKHCNGSVPDVEPDKALFSETDLLRSNFGIFMNGLQFASALGAVFLLVDKANKYLNDQKPWNLFKEGKQNEAEIVLYTVLEMLRSVTCLLYPFIPNIASDMWSQLGFEKKLEDLVRSQPDDDLWTERANSLFNPLSAGQKIKRSGPVFNRIEEKVLSN